ncbi:MAG: hypothetical protein ACSHYA_06465 [Opitutaceae bacterium]
MRTLLCLILICSSVGCASTSQKQKEKNSIKIKTDDHTHVVEADSVEQLISNLVLDGLSSMQESTEIQVEIAHFYHTKNRLPENAEELNRYIEVRGNSERIGTITQIDHLESDEGSILGEISYIPANREAFDRIEKAQKIEIRPSSETTTTDVSEYIENLERTRTLVRKIGEQLDGSGQ